MSKFETGRWSDARLLEEFLGFDFSSKAQPNGVLNGFLRQYGLTHQKALKLQMSVRDDLASVLTRCRYQPVRITANWPRLAGVASIDELLKKIESRTPKLMWDFCPEDRSVRMLPVIGSRPEQRLYQIFLSLLIDKTFWRLALCRYCGRIFFGTKYCSEDCREDWHNRYTRAPAVYKRRAELPRKTGVRKKRDRTLYYLGQIVFEEFKNLLASNKLNPHQCDRVAWIKHRLLDDINTDLSWDKLPPDHRKQFQRIQEMEQ